MLRALLGPGDTFVDGGANLGVFTLLGAARVSPGGRVEPFDFRRPPDLLGGGRCFNL